MSKKLIRNIFIVLLLLIVAGVAIGYKMWNKPHDKVEDAEARTISSEQLVSSYNANEQDANKNYLEQALEVSGTVAEANVNQDEKLVVMLDGGEGYVVCTMRDANEKAEQGQSITVRGFCTGLSLLGDVGLTDCVIIK